MAVQGVCSKFSDIEVSGSITIQNPDSDVAIKIMATPDGAGIWIGSKTFVTIQNIDGNVCVALGQEKQAEGHAVAISVNEKTGEPYIQLCRPGREPIIVEGDKLTKLFGGQL